MMDEIKRLGGGARVSLKDEGFSMTNEQRKALVERLRLSAKEDDYAACRYRWGQAADQIEADGQRIAELEALCDRLKIEVQCHAMEARGANATINEINQAVSGATGEKGNWHGAGPAKSRIAALEAENDRRADLIGVLQGKLELAREALSNLLALGPDHDGWCQIGPIYNCTCDQFPARQAARAALEAMGIDHD